MPDPENYGEQKVFEVLVTRTLTQTMAIHALSADAALRDARERSEAGEEMWEYGDDDAEVISVDYEPRDTEAVYTGGEDGDWVPWSELKK